MCSVEPNGEHNVLGRSARRLGWQRVLVSDAAAMLVFGVMAAPAVPVASPAETAKRLSAKPLPNQFSGLLCAYGARFSAVPH